MSADMSDDGSLTGSVVPQAHRTSSTSHGTEDLSELVKHLHPSLLIHADRFFASRTAAAKARPKPFLRRIFTLEGGFLVVRGANQAADPLFDRFPTWGAMDRLPLTASGLPEADPRRATRVGSAGQVQPIPDKRDGALTLRIGMDAPEDSDAKGGEPDVADQILSLLALNPIVLQERSPRLRAIPESSRLVVTHVPGPRAWYPTSARRDGQETNRRLKDPAGRWWRRLDLGVSGAEADHDAGDAPDAPFRSGPGETALTLQAGWLILRSRTSRTLALHQHHPFWGIEKAIALDGGTVRPALAGQPQVDEALFLDLGAATDLVSEIQWQCHTTGIGGEGWTVIPGTGSSRFCPGAGHVGAWIRARVRGPATGRRWVLSNTIGPVEATDGLSADPALIATAAALMAPQEPRRPAPQAHRTMQDRFPQAAEASAPLPLDLYRDPDFRPGTNWLGRVRTALLPQAATLRTTYSPGENVIHPCIVEFPDDFCGFRYLCAITAYPRGPAREDPFIYGSNDRITWTLLADTPQPLDVRKQVTGAYNSDTFITHDPGAGTLVVGYRSYEPRSDESAGPANADVVIKCRTTRDGCTWTEPEELMRMPADRKILLSPTMIFDPETGIWHMWTIDRPVMHHWTAPSRRGPWSLDPADTPLGMFRMPHHHEVKWVGDRLVCLLYARQNGNLYFGVFKPGSWTEVDWGLTPLLEPRPACLYKASFVPVHDPDAGTLAFDLWWTRGAAGPAGGIDAGHGRKLQYARTLPVAL